MDNASFLPEDYLERRAQRRTNIFSLLLFVIVMGGVVGAFFVTDRQRTEVRSMKVAVNKQFEEAARRLEQLEQLQARKEQMIQKAKVAATLLERVPRTLVLSELINNMPKEVSLLEFTMDTKVLPKKVAATALDQAKADAARNARNGGVPEPEVIPTEVMLNLVGVAPTDVMVAQYMSDLGKSPLFTELNLAFSEETTIDQAQMRKFRIELKVNQDVDLAKVEPLMVQRGELKQNPMRNTLQKTAQSKIISPNPPAPEAPRAVPASDKQ